MQYIYVDFSEARTVRSGGNAVGPTNQTLGINNGTHTFTLSDPQDYAPPSQIVTVTGTSSGNPLELTFTKIDALLAALLPNQLHDLSQVAPTAAAALAHFAPLGLDWETGGNDAFGKAYSQAELPAHPTHGRGWVLTILERASRAEHRHNGGGLYGELVLTLAGELDDVDANGNPLKQRPGYACAHGEGSVHRTSAPVFWVGLFHQPRGVTPLV